MSLAAALGDPGASLWRGLVVQTEVVHAVVMRETRTRFGAHRLGYLWAIIEPVIIILTFYGLGRLANRAAPPGMDIYTFITTGLVPYNLFAICVNRVAESINGNKSLLYYPHVQPIDIAIARCSLEAATAVAVFMVLIAMHALYLQELVFDSLVLTLFGLTLAALLGAVVGLVFCCLGQISNVADRVRGPLLRPLFWISGIFFTAEAVPGHLRRAALTNPVLHTVEIVRSGWFPSYGSQHADPGYVLGWIAVLGLLGLVLERVVRRRIELT